jgi:meiotically up-regulated gene 157 (Mug157) protein
LKIIEDSNASLIIKGDDHLFYIVKYNTLENNVESWIDFNKNSSNFYVLNLQERKHDSSSFYELSIPTCSYRMGVPNMGYGVMTISKNGNAIVSILWLPSRYTCLYVYLIFIAFIFILILARIVFSFIFKLMK